MARRLGSEQAQAALLGFMIGAVVFSASFYYVVESAVENPADVERAEVSYLTTIAKQVAGQVFSRGTGWYSQVTCVDNPTEPDQPSDTYFTPEDVGSSGRFGLGAELCEPSYVASDFANRLAYKKISNLYDANISYAFPSNGAVDYPEARASLGLDDQVIGFQVRAWPVLANIRQMLEKGVKDQYMKVLYIGQLTGPVLEGGKSPQTAAMNEIRFLDVVVEHFEAGVPHGGYGATEPLDAGQALIQIPRSPTGNVYPADGQALKSNNPVEAERLETALKVDGEWSIEKYNTIVIGSEVDQGELNPSDIKTALTSWVTIAGGTLIALGGPDTPQSYMNSDWKTKQKETTDNTVTINDHPILRTPNRLDASHFQHGTFWEYSQSLALDRFTQVVKNDGSGATQTVTAVGKPGQFGAGRVHITSWKPGALVPGDTSCTTPEPTCQGLFLIHNLLTLSYERLYMEYGPDPPEYENVASVSRLGVVYHPTLKRDVDLGVQVLVFAR